MVRRVFNLVYREVRGLHQAAYILALFAVGSQLLAIVRDRLLAHLFGAGPELDVYYAAFRIPDFLFVLFASILSVYVLLPFVTKAAAKNGEPAGGEVLSQIFTFFLIVFTLVAAALAIFAPFYVPKLFPGLSGQYEILILLTRILLIQAFLLGISNLCGIVTQAGNRFVLFALSPILYNIGIILGIVFFYPLFGLAGLVYGVVLGALGHLLIQVPFVVQSEYRFSLVTKLDWKLIGRVLRVAIPRGITLSINQLILLIFTGMATTMAIGSVAVFQFALNLQSVPLAIVGMSYSVAAFPALSRLLAEKKQQQFNKQLLTALRHIVFWSVPIMMLVVVLRAQIVRVLLGSGAFDWADTRLTAAVLGVFVLSLVAQSVLLLLIRAFYADGRTLIPLIVSIVSASAAVGSALWLRVYFQANSHFQEIVKDVFRLENLEGTEVILLATGFVIGQFIQLVLLILISRKVFAISYSSLYRLTAKATLAGLAGAFVAYLTLLFIVDGINQETFIGIGIQGVVAGMFGTVAVIMMYWFLKAPELEEIHHSFKAKIFKTDVVAPQKNIPS